ncbi:MAG: alpha/beta hydrolase [Nitrospinaceae bacterium]|nr:alpha/beta hydrolase [Nitrospinaceae bacterium]MBT3435346.1 alpha/beta hydrolase [Nitrospinaceae bacterium]MBT3822974.1 alpha/beta hydrolase [Nitrospinaceae bacterium]MBT4092763.1 alpha/beta hydrolase [Nitrospinaceae bacterium]MBT4429270.1 alpha/beta hydrolase [Nitrospinaceae bacterium]
MSDRSRLSHKWISEEFYKVHDVYAFRSTMFVEWGFRPADVKRTTERIKVPGAVVKEWARTAAQEEGFAREAEEAGHRESAAELYYRAALYYGPACGTIHTNSPRKQELYAKMIACYEKFIELFEEAPVERVEIPFESGKSIPGILQTVPGVENAPCVLVVPGMDTIKEYMPSPYHNHFRRRGIATLSIDGPGQGESNVRENWVTLDNFERAGSAAIDYLEGRPEVDASRVGLYGWSMGSYWGPRVAAHDDRLKACVGAMGVYLQKDTIFNLGKPAYRTNYMYMSDIHDEDEFDVMLEQMTLEPIAEKIDCPMLLAMGEFDELCPLEDAEQLFDLLKCPKELWVYENETHTLGSRLPDFYLAVADWLLDALNGKFDNDHTQKRFFNAR